MPHTGTASDLRWELAAGRRRLLSKASLPVQLCSFTAGLGLLLGML